MNDFFDNFLSYLDTTPKEELLNTWSKYEEFDNVGPRIEDFILPSLQFAFSSQEKKIEQVEFNTFNQYCPEYSSGFFI